MDGSDVKTISKNVKPLNLYVIFQCLQKEVEEEKYEPKSTKKRKNKAGSKKQGPETEKRYSGHSELIRRTKDGKKSISTFPASIIIKEVI